MSKLHADVHISNKEVAVQPNFAIHNVKNEVFVNFVLFTRVRILTNETQLNCFIPLSYSLIYIECVKSYSAKFVRNHSLIRYFLHFDWLLPSTDLKGSFKVALIM